MLNKYIIRFCCGSVSAYSADGAFALGEEEKEK